MTSSSGAESPLTALPVISVLQKVFEEIQEEVRPETNSDALSTPKKKDLLGLRKNRGSIIENYF